MNKKRDRLEVIYDILKVINKKENKANPTHILYKSNLSHKMLKEYLKNLIEKDLIKENSEKRKKTYALTEKGKKFLLEYRSMINFLDYFGLRE